MGSHKNKLILTYIYYTVMFKFLLLANILVSIVKMESDIREWEHEQCLRECRKCISDDRPVCKASSIFHQKFLQKKDLVTCCDEMFLMIVWKKNTRPSSMLCLHYCNGIFLG